MHDINTVLFMFTLLYLLTHKVVYPAYTSLPGLPPYTSVPGSPVYLFQCWDIGLIMKSKEVKTFDISKWYSIPISSIIIWCEYCTCTVKSATACLYHHCSRENVITLMLVS